MLGEAKNDTFTVSDRSRMYVMSMNDEVWYNKQELVHSTSR